MEQNWSDSVRLRTVVFQFCQSWIGSDSHVNLSYLIKSLEKHSPLISGVNSRYIFKILCLKITLVHVPNKIFTPVSSVLRQRWVNCVFLDSESALIN